MDHHCFLGRSIFHATLCYVLFMGTISELSKVGLDRLLLFLQFKLCSKFYSSNFFYRYAYSGEVGDDDEEAQSLTKATSDGNIGLVRIDDKERNRDHDDDDAAEDKQE